jgi:hypothetical protein
MEDRSSLAGPTEDRSAVASTMADKAGNGILNKRKRSEEEKASLKNAPETRDFFFVIFVAFC